MRRRDLERVLETGEPCHQEIEISFAHGCAWRGVMLTAIKDKKGVTRAVLGVARDITERKRSEDALRESWARFQQFFESLPTYAYMVSPEGIVLDVNRAALEALGYERDELVGEPLAKIYAPEVHARMKVLLKGFKHTGQLLDEEMVVITKAGERRVVSLSAVAVKDAAGRPLHSASVQVDVTERKKAEEALRDSEERFSTAFRASPVGMVMATLDGTIVDATEAFCELVGYSHEELLGGTGACQGILDAQERGRLLDTSETVSGGLRQGEVDVRTRDGTPRTVLFSSETIVVGGVPHRLATGIDISERKRLDQLKSDFLAMISHELRTPLTVIMGFADVIEKAARHGDVDKVLNAVARTKARSADMVWMVDEILRIMQLEAGESMLRTSGASLAGVVDRALELVSVPSDRHVRRKVEDGPPKLVCDVELVAHALADLLNNAVKFSPEGSDVLVKARIKKDHALFEVADRGGASIRRTSRGSSSPSPSSTCPRRARLAAWVSGSSS